MSAPRANRPVQEILSDLEEALAELTRRVIEQASGTDQGRPA
jgi:hypothetical protein